MSKGEHYRQTNTEHRQTAGYGGQPDDLAQLEPKPIADPHHPYSIHVPEAKSE